MRYNLRDPSVLRKHHIEHLLQDIDLHFFVDIADIQRFVRDIIHFFLNSSVVTILQSFGICACN